jgi:hypothetical protein
MKADVCTPQVSLYTDFKNEHSKLSFEAMKEEVAANLAVTGLQLQWRSLSASQPESTSGELVIVSFTVKCRMNEQLLSRSESGPLGWTYIEDGRDGPTFRGK